MEKAQASANIGFEKQIWDAACVLRGNMDASEYKSVVLGLIFLKYISDRFEERRAELLKDEYADPEDKDEYLSENVFFVPASSRWSVIAAAAHTPEIGTIIDEAMRAIEKENSKLKDVLPKNSKRHIRQISGSHRADKKRIKRELSQQICHFIPTGMLQRSN